MKNIILIGMSGAGKSTLGVLLAKAMAKDFLDTDLVIQQISNRKLHKILEEEGIDGFKKIEESVLLSLNPENTVIATGGSAVYSEQGMNRLKALGTVVFIDVPFEEIMRRIGSITTRGIVIEEGQSLEELFLQRAELYHRYMDLTVEVKNRGIEETVSTLVGLFD